MVYLIKIKPFEQKKRNYIEYFNEAGILLISYLLPLVTDLFEDGETRFLIGWVILGIVLLIFFVNTLMIIVDMSLNLVRLIKKIILRCKKRKIA